MTRVSRLPQLPCQNRRKRACARTLLKTYHRRRRQSAACHPGNFPPGTLARSASYLAFLAFFARRASRYFLIVAFGRSLCLAQTIPKTGAALLEQPGTGQS